MYSESNRSNSHESQYTISELQISLVKPTDGIVGFASFVYNQAIYLGSVAILSRPGGGYRLLYPTRKIGTNHIDVFHPINRDVGMAIEAAVTQKFEEVMKQGSHEEAKTDY